MQQNRSRALWIDSDPSERHSVRSDPEVNQAYDFDGPNQRSPQQDQKRNHLAQMVSEVKVVGETGQQNKASEKELDAADVIEEHIDVIEEEIAKMCQDGATGEQALNLDATNDEISRTALNQTGLESNVSFDAADLCLITAKTKKKRKNKLEWSQSPKEPASDVALDIPLQSLGGKCPSNAALMLAENPEATVMLAANAVIQNDLALFQQAKNSIERNQETSQHQYAFLRQLMELKTNYGSLNNSLGTIRQLLNKALIIAIQELYEDAIYSILDSCQEKRLMLCISVRNLEVLINAEAFWTLTRLVSASVQLEKPRVSKSVDPTALDSDLKRETLTLCDSIEHLFSMEEENSFEPTSDKQLRMMIALQQDLEYEKLASVMLRRECSETMFTFFRRQDLGKESRKKAVIAFFLESIRTDELALALKVWDWYKKIVDKNFERVSEEIVNSFIRGPNLLEFKFYLLTRVASKLSFGHINRILTYLEKTFSNAQEGAYQYFSHNLSPIKTSTHLLKLLQQIEDFYPVTSLRTQNLTRTILAQSKQVLDNMFFPEQVSLQLRQVDMLNRDGLHYLERLNAFEIMETQVIDRVMQEYWNSNLDARGSILAYSTAYGILTASQCDSSSYHDHDHEFENRFFKQRDVRGIQPHQFCFAVVRKSMQTRYLMDTVFFYVTVFLFQYAMVNFAHQYQIVKKVSNRYYDITIEIEAGGAVNFQDIQAELNELIWIYLDVMPELTDWLVLSIKITFCALMFPCKALLSTIHIRLTKRDYSYQIDDFADFGMLVCLCYWYYTLFDWSNNFIPKNWEKTFTENNIWTRYTHIAIWKDLYKEFYLLPFLATVLVFMWGRLILMLQLSKNFGPMLRTILVMIGDCLRFLFIWSIMLLCMAAIALLLFGELEEYSSYSDVLILIFGTGIGDYDMSVFDNLEIGPELGQIFIVAVVIINAIVLLNFIIAILADTYSKFSQKSLGLFYDGIIARIPVYEDDARFGALVVGAPILNVLAILLVPFYCLIKDESKLKRLNDIATKLLFVPVALFFTALITGVSFLLTPFAYLAAIKRKISICCHRRDTGCQFKFKKRKGSQGRTLANLALDFFIFVTLGPLMLLMSLIVDACYFFVNLYRDDIKEYQDELSKEYVLTEAQFEVLELFCKSELERLTREKQSDPKKCNSEVLVPAKQLVVDFREQIGIVEHVHRMLFHVDDSPQATKMVNFFNQVKKVIIRSSNEDKLINLRSFTELIHELRVRLDITKAGLAAERNMRTINFGISSNSKRSQVKRQRRIEEHVLRDFNMINLARVQVNLSSTSTSTSKED